MRFFVAGLMLAVALPAFADGKATIVTSDTQQPMQMIVHWSGDKMRMDFPSAQQGYMLMRDGKSLMVTEQNGQTITMDMAFFKNMASEMGGTFNSKQAQTVDSLEATGDTETIAGIEGDIYHIQWTDRGGNAHDNEIVLSDDPLAREMLQAFQTYSTSMTDEADPIGAALLDRGLGMLRFDGRFRIDEISDTAPADDTFAIPQGAISMRDMLKQRLGSQ